jgi:putative lipoprotein
VQIDAQRPIPPNAVLSIQLHRVNQDGITFSNVLDEQQSPISEPKPVAFELAYTRPDLVPIPGGGIPEAYLVYAELRAPGRVTWRAESEPLDLQTSPVSVTVMLTPPAHIGEISGTLTIPDQPTLPADAVLTVRLTSEDGYGGFDDNRAELVVTPVKPGKLPFILEYLTMAIDAQHSYAIHAEVRVGAKLPLTSPLVPAITQGQPTNVDAVLTPPKEIAAVTGTMMYEAGQPLPADALLTVQIEDVSGADGPSYVLASHTMKPDSSPIPFAIEYDPALIRRSADYAVSAKITAGEQLLFITEMRNMVITSGDSKPVEMVLKRIK